MGLAVIQISRPTALPQMDWESFSRRSGSGSRQDFRNVGTDETLDEFRYDENATLLHISQPKPLILRPVGVSCEPDL